MPEQAIHNVAGIWGETAVPNTPHYQWLVNNSAATRTAGDVVVIDVTGVLANTTTTPSDTTVVGVVATKDPSGSLLTAATSGFADTYPAGAVMPVITQGTSRVNIAANTVAAGAALASSAAAGVAAAPGVAANVGALQALVGSFIAIALESQAAKDANNTIRCYIQKM